VAVPTDAGPLKISLTGDALTYAIAPYNRFRERPRLSGLI